MAQKKKGGQGKGSGGKGGQGKGSGGKGGAQAATEPVEQTTGQRITWICLHLIVFLVPLAISNFVFLPGIDLPFTFDQFDIVKVFTMRALALVALAAWAWDLLKNGGKVRFSKVEWLILAFMAWLLITTIFSIHPPTAVFGKYRRFEGMLSFITYAVVFFLTLQTANRPRMIRSLATTLVAGGAIVGLYGVSQWVGYDWITWGNLPFEENRGFSTFGNPDLLGGYLIFPLAISATLALSEKKTWWRVAFWVAFLILVFAWLTAFVRGAWIGGGVALLVIAFVAIRSRTKIVAADAAPLAALGLGTAGIIYWSLQNTNSVLNIGTRIASIFQFDQGSAKTRFEIWEAAIAATKDRPILGFGADTFRLIFPKYKPYEYVADGGYISVADNVHNYPLQLTSAIGIPGFLMLYGIFGWALIVSAKDALLSKEGGQRLVFTGFWAAAAGYIVHLMFGISVTGSTVFLWISLAILLTASAKTIEVAPSAATWRTVVAFAVIALVAVLSIANVVYVYADNQHMMARIGATTLEDRIEFSKNSIRLNPWNDMYRAELGLAYQDALFRYTAEANQLRDSGQDPTVKQGQAEATFSETERAILEAIEFVPAEYDNYVFLTNLYNFAAAFIDPSFSEKAIEIGLRGVEVEPFGPAVRVQLSRAYIATGDYEAAEEHLTYAAEMDPKYLDARIFLADVYIAQERWDEAKAVLEEALVLAPDDQSLLDTLAQVEAELEGQ